MSRFRCLDCDAPITRLAGNGRAPTRCPPCRRYRMTHTGTDRAYRMARSFVAPVVRRDIFERDGWTCGICAEPVDRSLVYPDPMSATIDHIVSLAAGGLHGPSNVQLSHLRCNLKKGWRPQGVAAVA